jgi:hypothetical protein
MMNPQMSLKSSMAHSAIFSATWKAPELLMIDIIIDANVIMAQQAAKSLTATRGFCSLIIDLILVNAAWFL